MGLSIDKALISAILRDGLDALREVRESGVAAHLRGDGKLAWEFIDDYAKQYSDLPSKSTVEGRIDAEFFDVKEPVDYFIKTIWGRRLTQDILDGRDKVEEHIGQGQPYEALDELETLLRNLRKAHTHSRAKLERIPALWPDVIDYYDRVKAGERGVLTPWPTVNDETLGFWPEDLALFVARLGVGKTWCAAVIAHHAWKNGHKILFGTTEMSKLRIAMRFASIQFRVPYRELRLGRLDAFAEKRLKDGVKEIMEAEGLYVIGGDFDFRVESYENAVEEAEPDLAVLDGAYLLKTEGRNRTERAANAFDELKRICKRTGVPNVVTMQFNREVKPGSKQAADASNIALTDVAGWNADLIYGLIQTEDMKKDRRMIFKPLKVRESEGKEYEINWDIDKSNFTELPRAGAGGFGSTDPWDSDDDDDSSDGDSGVPF